MTELRPIQAVVFDAAGTLIRNCEPVGETYARFARNFGVDLPPPRVEDAFRRVMAAAPPNVYPGEAMAPAALLEKRWWWERVRETFRAADQMVRFSDFGAYFESLWVHFGTAAAWQLLPDARAVLGELRDRHYLLALLSNFDQRLRPLLSELDILDLFDSVTLPVDAGAAKPERLIFDVCLEQLGVANHRSVYIGDRLEEDLQGSKAAGMHPIDVASLATLGELPARLEALEKDLR
ncbi:MAG: HAD-IA family hydrolase [bacterium]|nr:HAD-IA family hydrolase [bacterium]MCP5067013.1 HAD-IA family hydrolase [bacterium]